MSESDAHIQDSQILEMTRQEPNDAGTRIKFVATLPSGRLVETPFFDPGKRREMLLKWLEGVRGEIVKDEEEGRAKAKRKQQEQSSVTAPSVSAQVPQMGSSNFPSFPVAPLPQSAPPSNDPVRFVRQALSTAEQTAAYWQGEAARATANWQAAQADLQKWRQIEQSLNGMSTHEEMDIPAAASSDFSEPTADVGSFEGGDGLDHVSYGDLGR